MDEPRLERTAEFRVVGDGTDGLTLEGYAAVFGATTRIDSWEGQFDELLVPGAFARTLDRKGPKGIRLQFDHGRHPLIGSIPLGAISEMREDARGLYVKARLTDNWLVQPIRDAIADGAIDGMSFQFRVVNDDWDKTGDVPLRTIREVELFELGPVVWPAYPQTTVGVRAAEVAQTLMDPQQRIEVARALLAGTSEEPDSTMEPSDEPADVDDPAAEALRRDRRADAAEALARISDTLAQRKDRR